MAGAIYTRISKDRTGQEAGVTRQLKDCRVLAEKLGLRDPKVFKDDDVSATSGRARPAFEKMMDGVRAGKFDRIIVWKIDRLYRRMIELETLIDLVESTGVRIETVESGGINLSSVSGRGQARILVSVSQMEAENIAYRTKRAALERAEKGLPSGGSRSFGYRYRDGAYVVDHDEAAELRAAVDAIISGRTLTSIIREWNERGLKTPKGSRWTTKSLSRVIRTPTVVGLRGHKGITYPGTWEAILTPEDQDLASRTIESRKAATSGKGGRPAESLLSGLILCGSCGGKLYASEDRYVCSVGGHVSILQSRLDNHVVFAVDEHRPRPPRRKSGVQEARRLTKSRLEAQERLDGLAEEYGRGDLNQREYRVASRAAEKKLQELGAKIDSLPQEPRSTFRKLGAKELSFPDRQAWIWDHVSSVTVAKGRVVGDRVRIDWNPETPSPM